MPRPYSRGPVERAALSTVDPALETSLPRRGLVLAVVLAGTVLTVVDVAIVNVAIPSLQQDLDASFGAVALVVTSYTLVYACLLVTGGRLGDIYGRRRLFVTGLLIFTGSSALCGLAPSIDVLIAARVLQGVGGALMYPQVLAVIQVTFTGEERTRALGIFGAVAGFSAIGGQLVGGLLLSADLFGLEWRPVFLVNVPLGALATVAALVVLPRDRPEGKERLDLGGVALLAVALAALMLPLLTGRDAGWPAWLMLLLVLSAPALAVFALYELQLRRRGGAPLVPLELFRNRSFAGGIPIALLFTASYASFLLLLVLYLQEGLGFSPLASGATYTPAALGFLVTSLTAPPLVRILGRHVLTVGYLLAALGLLATAATADAAGPALHGWELAPTLFVAGLGQGLGMSPLVGTIVAGVPPGQAGAASGVVTTVLQAGNVLGVALTGLVFYGLLDGSAAEDYTQAFVRSFPLCALLILLAAALVHRLPRTQYETDNALVERLPGWASSLAYSMFLMTGGRVGERMFADEVANVSGRRRRRAEEAPADPGEYLAYQFGEAAADRDWIRYLVREALNYDDAPIPHEEERLPVIQAQVDEIRRRQEAGLLDPDLDPALLRLLAFALTNYPRVLPQITRMTTGRSPHDPEFVAAWQAFLRDVGGRLR
jgi:EmrB/QacA subfamily drug resistance transporter